MNVQEENALITNWDWNKFLKAAMEGNASKHLIHQAIARAREWVTCAVGEQCQSLPRNVYGIPQDWELYILGTKFDMLISGSRFTEAKSVLIDIEIRSGELLRQMAKGEIENG